MADATGEEIPAELWENDVFPHEFHQAEQLDIEELLREVIDPKLK